MQTWHLDDSDERGVGNIAGLGFRRWGDVNGSGPVKALTSRVQLPPDPSTIRTQTDMVLAQTLRRAHPLFAPTVLLFLQVRPPSHRRRLCTHAVAVLCDTPCRRLPERGADRAWSARRGQAGPVSALLTTAACGV